MAAMSRIADEALVCKTYRERVGESWSDCDGDEHQSAPVKVTL